MRRVTDSDAEHGALHDWRIEDREYARHESRRGRRFAYPELDGSRTALVVIDLVTFFAANPYVRGIVPNVARLADGVRAAAGSVAWVVPEVGEPSPWQVEFFGREVAGVFSGSGVDDSPRDRLWPGLPVRDDDLLVEKSAYSAFFPGRCELPRLLEERGVDTVLIAGTVTNVCCESSARDASTLGFRVIMVADANAARRDADHNATLHTVYRSFGDVRATEEVLELLGAPSRGGVVEPSP